MQARDVILVVDDDPVFLRSIARLLEIHMFDVKAYASAASFQTAPLPTDAVCMLLDLDLRGISGIEVRRQLTLSGAPIPVIYMTGSWSERCHEAAAASGCVSVLVKPFGAALLLSTIHAARGSFTHAEAFTPNDPKAT